MNCTKTKLTEKQFQIHYKHTADTWAVDSWIRDQGFTLKAFTQIEGKILKAQQQAHLILKHHPQFIDESQRRILVTFHRKFFNDEKRKTITAEAALKVLNIATKINRKLFNAHRKI
jgi:predicted glycoside hydrolase/deacetylase ChbG (UPF0249 family)